MALPPLDGINVVDFAWLMVGPESARYLADLGAEVVKVESGVRIDPLRFLGPYKDGVAGPNRSLSYHAINAGKRSVTLDVGDPRGHEAFLRLARWADVLIEAFTPGVAAKLKLSWEHLSRQNPRLIMVSTSILGLKGPASAGMSGTGNTGAAFAGARNLLGWPDREPAGPHGPWTDSVTPRFIVASILAALHRRSRTGKGCFIDASQSECGLQFLMPAYFEYAVNGLVPQRRGAAGSPLRVPAGIYKCAGDDRWIAFEASDAVSWKALRAIVGGILGDARFDTLIGRMRGRTELGAAISAFTAAREPAELESELQQAGVPCHVVATAQDLAADADLKAEAYYQLIQDPEIGGSFTRGPQAKLSRTPHAPTRPGPRIGDSTRDVLEREAGYSSSEVDDLEAAGLLR